jgi:Kef-type K+ transport system membrane component KefB
MITEPARRSNSGGDAPAVRLSATRALTICGALLAGVIAVICVVSSKGQQLTAGPPSPQGTLHEAASIPDTFARVLVALLAVLVVGRSLAVVFRYLGQPPVIGEVVGGIILGPSVLGRIWPEAAASILPPAVAPFLGVISQLGVILYMFIVGLELNPQLLRGRMHAAATISFAGIAVPFSLGLATALILYPRLSSGDVTFTSFSLFVGVATSVTAFPVLARILTDRGLQRTRLGVTAIGCAATDDAAAWCMLAVVIGVAQAKFEQAFVMVGLTIAFVGFMVFVGRPLAIRLLGRLSEDQMSPATVGGVFAALLFSALVTETIGIHAIFGAFILGAIIPRDGAVARVFSHKLGDLVTILLLPAFFALTGMRTEIGLVTTTEEWLLCGLIVLVATVGKFGGVYVASRLCGMRWRQAAGLGALMNTRGLMELIVLNVGLDLKIISPSLFAMMVLMSLVTTIATAPIVAILTPKPPNPDCAEWTNFEKAMS